LGNTQTLVFNWVILDASRGFDVDSSKSALEASQANQADIMLSVFADVSHDYFSAQSASAALNAAIELRATAQSSYQAAKSRADLGVAPVSDALQAQTALVEAELEVVHAQGDLHTATGALAWRMGLRPDSTLVLPVTDESALAAPPTSAVIDELISRVRDEHPHAVQAARQFDAARARVKEARADLLPKLSLSVRAGHDSTPVTPFTGSPPLDARARFRSASISVNVPLFDGFGSNYRIDQAERAMEVSRSQLEEAREQVANDAWAAFQAVNTAFTTFEQSRNLLATASASFIAANERYRAGVGTIADLLSAQASLTSSKNRRLQALGDWRSANALLWARLGQMRGL
jgi:outer membrane protein